MCKRQEPFDFFIFREDLIFYTFYVRFVFSFMLICINGHNLKRNVGIKTSAMAKNFQCKSFKTKK